jgi:hypothetical protein
MDSEHKYDDIINLEHHISKTHKQMSMQNRAAQFAPFAALTGYEEAVKETARFTEQKIELDEELNNILDEKLRLIQSQIKNMPEITVTYFVPDDKKRGGKYQKITGKIKKIDDYNKFIIFTDGKFISIKDIINISGETLTIT